jgi:hypothetical protein
VKGELFFRGNDIEAVEFARWRVLWSEKYMELPTVKSERTIALQREVKERFMGI